MNNLHKMKLQAPFPYFGGKSAIAHQVWEALGQPKHYIEPFFGSGAVLLARPNYDPTIHVEIICDKDGLLCNVWRSLQFAPDEVAKWCDWPVNHADLNARRRALLRNEKQLLENLVKNDKWFDPVMAGYWIWAACCWIGSGLTSPDSRPHLSDCGMGVHSIGKIPHLTSGGKGVHAIANRSHIEENIAGVQEPYNTNLYHWFRELSSRLRNVRVVCGDWSRVCGGNWQDGFGIVGMFFDPPYGVADRRQDIYQHDGTDAAHDVTKWCADRGSKETYRIVLAGYEEHVQLIEKYGWTCKRWKARGGYGNANRKRECLYFSPNCLNGGLFDDSMLFQNEPEKARLK